MYRQYITRANAITDEIELILAKLQLARAANHPDEIDSMASILESLLDEYRDLRQEQKLQSSL